MRASEALTRLTVLVAIAIAILAAAAPRAAADAPAETIQVGGPPSSGPLAPGFVSFSFEYRALHQYTGRDPNHLDPVLVTLLRNLAPSGGAVLRVGGNSTDQTWWPVRGQIPPAGVNYTLTRGWLRVARALAEATGDQLLLGINLAANRPALAGVEASALIGGIGRANISALEIGNEPDLYSVFAWARDRLGQVTMARGRRYGLATLIREYARWRASLPAGIPVAGPAFATLAWAGQLSQFLADAPGIGPVTLHRYPLRGCLTDVTDPAYPTIPHLLADGASAGLAQALAPYVPIAHARGTAFRMDELNSASCTGKPGVSDTFASALWMVDALFNLASVGVDGVNVHTLPGASYEPFSFTHDRAGWHGLVHPSYYGALLFNRAFPAGARLLPVGAPGGPLKAWATQDTTGRVRVTLINKGPDPVPVTLQLPGGDSQPLGVQTLGAPAIDATNGVTLAGQTFGTSTDTGVLPGTPSIRSLGPGFGVYTLTVPPYTALLLSG